jgi:regulator of sigma E protease
MAIISAGVVFNIIFGVILAAVAYKMGVIYAPTVIGGANVGDPAWYAGVRPGDRIVSLDPDDPDSDTLRFLNDLKFKLFSLKNNEGATIDMRLKDTDGEVRPLTIEPFSGYAKQVGMPAIGVWMAEQPIVYRVIDGSVAQKAGLLPGDRVEAITVNGERTVVDPEGPGVELQAVLAKSQHLPITLSVARTDKETETESKHDLDIGVEQGKRFGLELSMGPIQCIQKGSVAEQIGLEVGDIITKIDDQPIGDPLTLPLRLLDYIDQEVELSVQRADSTQKIKAVIPAPLIESKIRRRNAPIGLDALGIGYAMYPTVTGVVAGSPAAEAGMQAGDVLESVRMALPDQPIPEDQRWKVLPEFQEYRAKRQNNRLLEAWELDKPVLVDKEHNNWPFVVHSMQSGILEFEVDVTFKRGSEVKTVHLEPAQSNSVVNTSRGMDLKPYEEVRVAETWSEAFALGRREVWEGMQQVVFLLRKIFSNYKQLGGPITIVTAATMEASEGIPRLLIFLTMLSANLAVLNFLPIPVLDGGHMVFLAWEGIVGKPVDERIQMTLTLIGFCLLMSLMIFVFGLDISRLMG